MQPTDFAAKKRRILEQLQVPAEEYQDASPKGTIDEAIRSLVNEINQVPGLVTTSSCAGRLSVYVEGQRKPQASASDDKEARIVPQESRKSGKGGGRWTYVSHEPIHQSRSDNGHYFHELFQLQPRASQEPFPAAEKPLIHFRFEAMILHIMCASLDDANLVLSAALGAGFRESGAVSLDSLPVVAVRSSGLMLDCIVGHEKPDGELVSIVAESYLQALVHIANERFSTNTQRIHRFRTQLLAQTGPGNGVADVDVSHPQETEGERRQRKRREGLLRQQLLREKAEDSSPGRTSGETDDFNGTMPEP